MLLRARSQPTPLARATASLAILLVLVLSVLAASPELHERLHSGQHAASHQAPAPGHPADSDDDGCVVLLFAQGLVLALAIFALAVAGLVARPTNFPAFERVAPEAPRYLRLPAQAPPLG